LGWGFENDGNTFIEAGCVFGDGDMGEESNV
jgi:hypothetical protein